jgi:hypothetical protein
MFVSFANTTETSGIEGCSLCSCPCLCTCNQMSIYTSSSTNRGGMNGPYMISYQLGMAAARS